MFAASRRRRRTREGEGQGGATASGYVDEVGAERPVARIFPGDAPVPKFLSLCLPLAALALAPALAQPTVPARPWSEAQVKAILDKTQTTRLAPDLNHLSPGERMAVKRLLE